MKTTYQIIYITLFCFTGITTAKAQEQRLPLDSVLARVTTNPALQAYDARISSQDAYAKGAKNLDAPN